MMNNFKKQHSMKSTVKFLAICLGLIYIAGCEDMNSVNQEYLDRGETIYTGRVDSAMVLPGNNRVKFLWQINSDPRINKMVLYWNESADSAVFDINRTQSGVMQFERELTLPEGGYVFEFVTKDNEGHRSVGVEQSVEIYGERYIASLQNRSTTSITVSSGIKWLSVLSSTTQYTVVEYVDYSDPEQPERKSVRVENDEDTTALPGAKSGETVSITTSYLPVNGLDVVSALPKEYGILP
jgi:hypothetical protein